MLHIEPVGPVMYVTLRRADVRNALNSELIERITNVFTTLPVGTRVVVLDGDGPAFCAGADLEYMRRAGSQSVDQNYADALLTAKMFESIATCTALVIVRAHGAVMGGGCGIVAASDVAIAETGTKFAFSEVKLGLIPATISRFVVPKIGPGNARWLFSTGVTFDADIALRIGLIHAIASSRVESDTMVREQIDAALQAGPEAVAAAKRLVSEGPLTLEETAKRLAERRASAEAIEGLSAFLQKRSPSYKQTI